MGRLVRAMRRMQQALASSVSKVRDASSQIDTGSRGLAAGNLHLAQRSAHSAKEIKGVDRGFAASGTGGRADGGICDEDHDGIIGEVGWVRR